MSARSWLSSLLRREPAEATQAKPSMAMSTEVAPVHKQEPARVARQEWASEADIPATWEPGEVILDLYEVKEIFTSGGMGLVYRMHHRRWNMDLAVKSPRPQYFQTEAHKENFVREAETWVNLGLHPHIVSCYYVRTLGGIPRIFAEYVEGGSLADWIHQRKLYEGGSEQTLERLLDVAIQYAWGLHYAHEQGLVHQDVKPANVMMASDGIAKVTDFGLAKARALVGNGDMPGGTQSILVSVGGMTPAYCSPEQAAGAPLSRKTDIWSWGLSVLEMFMGEITWQAGQIAPEALDNYLETGPVDSTIPVMPLGVVDILKRCFQREPRDRPANMLEVTTTLQEICQQGRGNLYPREIPKTVELKADGLNNRGVSYVDLGREEDAVACWQKALQDNPRHFEATFNYGYWRWRKGELPDDVYVTQMLELDGSRKTDPDYWRCLVWIHLGRGDIEAVERIQQSEYRVEWGV